MKPNRLFVWLLVLGLLIFSLVRSAAESQLIPLNDYIEYWSAGRLFLAGNNPYSAGDMLKLQQHLGWSDTVPLMMWNPPWVLLVVFPFALMPFWLARGAWFVFHLTLTVVCADILWRLYNGPGDRRWVAWLTAVFFIPDAMAFYLGQISPLLLAGMTGFLLSLQKNRRLLAGAFVLLITTKPHLLYVFWVFFLLWVLKERRWKTAAAAVFSITAAYLLILVKEPEAIGQYFRAMGSNTGPLTWQTPTLGTALRMVVNVNWAIVQFVPLFLGSLSAIWLWQRRKARFAWQDCMPDIIVLSVTMSCFSWTFDWVVLLPVALLMMIWFVSSPVRNWWLCAAFVFLQGLFFIQLAAIKNYFYTIWMPFMLALIYLAGKWKNSALLSQQEQQAR